MPFEHCLFARTDFLRFALHIAHLVVFVIDASAQPHLDGAAVCGVRDDPGSHHLSGIDQRCRHQIVGPHVQHLAWREGRAGDGGDLARAKRLVVDRKRAAAFEFFIADAHGLADIEPGLRAESLLAAGQREVELRAVLGRIGSLSAGEFKAEIGEIVGLAHRIIDRVAAIGGRDQHAVGDRSAPVGAFFQPFEAVHDAQQAADVAGIAVRVPAGCD